MVNFDRIKLFCEGDFTKIENFWVAYNDGTQMYEIHHRRETDDNKSRKQLQEEELYFKRPPDELIFLTKAEHAKLHNSLIKHQNKMTAEERSLAAKKAYQTRIRNGSSTTPPNKGIPMSDEQKAKVSAARKGKGTGPSPLKKEAMLQKRIAYKKYKDDGGKLDWNKWRQSVAIK